MIKLKYGKWQNITIAVYDKLKGLKDDEINTQEDELNVNIKLLSILCDVTEDEISNLPLTEFSKLIEQTAFLKDMPKYEIETRYKVGNQTYDVQTNIRAMTTAQFIDFQTLSKEQDKNFANLLACFLIPKGKKYGDGYDIIEVAEYLYNNMSIATARSIMFFFTLQYQALQKVILTYSIKQLKKEMRKTRNEEARAQLAMTIQQMTQLKTLIQNGAGCI